MLFFILIAIIIFACASVVWAMGQAAQAGLNQLQKQHPDGYLVDQGYDTKRGYRVYIWYWYKEELNAWGNKELDGFAEIVDTEDPISGGGDDGGGSGGGDDGGGNIIIPTPVIPDIDEEPDNQSIVNQALSKTGVRSYGPDGAEPYELDKEKLYIKSVFDSSGSLEDMIAKLSQQAGGGM